MDNFFPIVCHYNNVWNYKNNSMKPNMDLIQILSWHNNYMNRLTVLAVTLLQQKLYKKMKFIVVAYAVKKTNIFVTKMEPSVL